MGYYTGGDYYRAGDYYAAGGIFGTLGKLAGKAIGAVGRATGILPQQQVIVPAQPTVTDRSGGGTFELDLGLGSPKIKVGGGGRSMRQLGPGINDVMAAELGELRAQRRKKYRRMNYGNVKALRRADRRIDGFVGVARKALKHTNYKVVSKSAGKAPRRGSVSVSRDVEIN